MTTPPISPLAPGVADAANVSTQGTGKEAELAKEFTELGRGAPEPNL